VVGFPGAGDSACTTAASSAVGASAIPTSFCEDIAHRNTKVCCPRTNGYVERMNRALLDECCWVKERETFYLS
jgi:hypothetical protein